jgi:hypothetical protein
MKTIARTIDIRNNIVPITWALCFMLASLFIFYGYLVNRTVFNVVARERLQDEIADASTRISELEFQSITLKNSIDLERAYALGFNEVKSIQFIARDITVRGLTLGPNSIR